MGLYFLLGGIYPISGFYIFRLQTYLTFSCPHYISTVDGLLLINDPHMSCNILKITDSPPCLLMYPKRPQILSLLLFCQLLNLFGFFSRPQYLLQYAPDPLASSWVCPYPSYCHDRQSQTLCRDFPDSSIFGILHHTKGGRKRGEAI